MATQKTLFPNNVVNRIVEFCDLETCSAVNQINKQWHNAVFECRFPLETNTCIVRPGLLK